MSIRWTVPFTRLLLIGAAICLVAACAGDEGAPPLLTQNPQTTRNIQAAAGALVTALNKCRGGLTSSIQSALAARLPGRRPPAVDDTLCWDDLVLALLVWRQAPKQDGTIALNDPFYRQWIVQTVKRHMNATARDLGLTKEQQLAVFTRLYTGFTSYFMASAQRRGALFASEIGTLVAEAHKQGTAFRDPPARSPAAPAPGNSSAGAAPPVASLPPGALAPAPAPQRKYSIGYFY